MCGPQTYQALSQLSHCDRDGQPTDVEPSPPNMMYVSRATMARAAALWTGAAKESAKMLHAATNAMVATMIAVDSEVKGLEGTVQERVCN
jgi:hypothetical protein